MKIQCDVCERAEAVVLCCADEAALCLGCDVKVHAANKLAGKHQRVPLLFPGAASAASKMPCCDICQGKADDNERGQKSKYRKQSSSPACL